MSIGFVLVLIAILLVLAVSGFLIYIWILTIWKNPVLWQGAEIVSWASSSVIRGAHDNIQLSNTSWQMYQDVVLRLNVNGQMQNRRYASVRVCKGINLEIGPANLLVLEDVRFKPGKLDAALSIVAADQHGLSYSPIYLRECLPYLGGGCMFIMMVIASMSVALGILIQILCAGLMDRSSGIQFFVATPLLLIFFTGLYIAVSIWTKKRLYQKVEDILRANYPDQYII